MTTPSSVNHSKKWKILSIVGVRPQFVKAAVLSRLLRHHPHFQEIMVHTGQHFDADMSDVFFNDLEIPTPTHRLNIAGLAHGAMTGRMLEAIEKIIIDDKPQAALVYGDTNSTLAGALAASKHHIPVIHIEAGLRSFNRAMPEEINRLLVDHLSAALFCPTKTAIANLEKEGITQNVYLTGDIMYDATLFSMKKLSPALLKQYNITENQYALLTLHREENTNDIQHLQKLIDYVRAYGDRHGLAIIWPLHPRLRTLQSQLKAHGITLIEPMSYGDMQTLLQYSHSLLTDSGGLQKEAYFHKKPCITLRSETEWVETIHCGWNRLWTIPDYEHPQKPIDDYGTGDAGKKILTILEKIFLDPTFQ